MSRNEATIKGIVMYEERSKQSWQPSQPLNIMYKLLWCITGINFIWIISVIYSMTSRVTRSSLEELVSSSETLAAFTTTCTSVGVSVIIICMIGIPTAYILAYNTGKIYSILETVTCLPLVLPPSVAGLGMLMTFGTRGFLGSWLASRGIQVPFSFIAIVCTQVFIGMPFFIQILKGKLQSIEKDILEAAKVFGAGHKTLLLSICLPLSIRSIVTGVILCALRGAGEFGATIMFAGNFAGKTQTVTTRIYTLYQYDIMQAVTLAVIQLLVFLVPFMLLKIVVKY